MDTITIHGRINPAELVFLDQAMDSYEGIAATRTNDRKAGIVEFWVAPDFLDDFWKAIEDISTVMNIQIDVL